MNTSNRKALKTAASLTLVIALLTPYVGAVSPEQLGPSVGSETSGSQAAPPYPWKFDLGQKANDESPRHSDDGFSAREQKQL